MKDSFVQYFKDRGVSEDLAASVFKYLQKWMNRNDFNVKPKDDIYRVYGIVDEDLDDFVLFIAEENGLQIPASTTYWKSPVVTVEDLMDFLSSFTKLT